MRGHQSTWVLNANSLGAHTNEACHTNEDVNTHTPNVQWHTFEKIPPHVVMSHGTRGNESWHTHDESHDIPTNKPCHTNEETRHMQNWVMSHTWTSHVTQMNLLGTYGEVMAHTGTSHVTQMIESWHVTSMHASGQRRDRGIYSIWGGPSLYCLYFGISQLMGPEACFGIFVREGLGWLSNWSLYQTFSSKSVPFVPSRGDASKRRKTFSIWPFNLKGVWQRLLASPRLGTKGMHLLKISGTSFGCLVNRAILVQISQNTLRGP